MFFAIPPDMAYIISEKQERRSNDAPPGGASENGLMGIYTERKISVGGGFVILAAAFVALYGVWLLTGPELARNEGIYAAASAEFDIHGPAVATIHNWATPECFPLFPLVVHILCRYIGLPIETALRGLSILMLFAGTILVYLAASARRSCTAGWVASAMYFSSILALDKSVVGTPATGNAFFLLAAQLLFFEYGVRRSNWNLAWISAALLLAAGFFNGGVEMPAFFIFPMFFLRRPMSVSSKFRKAGFIAAIVIVAAAVLWWVKAYNAWPRRISLYDVWWRNLAMTGHFKELLLFPFHFVFMLLPWCLIAWLPFCVALQTLDTTPIFSRYLRTLVFANLALLWLLPELNRGAYFYVIGPLAILTGEFYELGMRRYGEKLRRFFVMVEIFMATVLVCVAAGCFMPETWLKSMSFISLGNSLAFRGVRYFLVLAAVMLVMALLLIWYVHACRRSDPVWMVILSVSLALALFFNGMMLPYRSQDRSKHKFGADIRKALRTQGPIEKIYTLKVSNLNGGLFYAGFPVHRLESAEELPRGRGELYLLCPGFPQSADFSWKNLLPNEYYYNGHPLALWKGTPRRSQRGEEGTDDGAAEEYNGEKK